MKTPLLFTLCIAAYLQLQGQTTFNIRDRYDFLACVLSSVYPTDSCYYVTGIIADTLEPYNTGALLMKLDLQGAPLWIKSLKNTKKTYETWFPDLVPFSDGGFFVAGYSIDSTFKTILIRWDSKGDTIFTKEYFSPNYPNGSFITSMGGMTQLANVNLAILNWIDNINATNSDTYLLLLDTLGNIINSKIFGYSKEDRPMAIKATKDGGGVLGGVSYNTNTNTQNYTFQCDITKVDSLGNVEWSYLSPSSIGLRDAANDLVVLEDGSVVVASGVGHEIEESSVNDVFFDRYIFKLNPQHQLEWELTFVDPKLTWASRTTSLTKLKDESGFILAGMSYYPPPVPPNNEPIYGVITKVSASGDSIWTRKYAFQPEHGYVHEIFDMKETLDGGLIICGQSNDWDDDATYPQQGWLLKLDQHGCLVPGCHLNDAIAEPTPHVLGISIYPNPTSDYLNFYINAPNPVSGATIRIIDSSGRLVKEFKTDNLSATFIIPVWEWANGAYWMQMVADGELVSTKSFLILN